MLATVPASSQHAWVTQVGPEDTGSFRQGLVVRWGCPSGTLSPQKKNEAGYPLFSLGSCFPHWLPQSSAWVLASPSTAFRLPDAGGNHQAVRGPPQAPSTNHEGALWSRAWGPSVIPSIAQGPQGILDGHQGVRHRGWVIPVSPAGAGMLGAAQR